MSSYELSIVIGTIVMGALVYDYIKSKYSIDDNDSGNDLPVYRPIYGTQVGSGGDRVSAYTIQDGSPDADGGRGASSNVDGGQSSSSGTDGALSDAAADGERADTLLLMSDVLKSIGCQPEKLEGGTLAVAYQGETFLIVPNNTYVRIWDAGWTNVDANDPDLPKIREAVNVANYSFGPTVVMTEPDENGMIDLHSRWDILFCHTLGAENADYMKSVFFAFFGIKEEVRRCYQSLRLQQQADNKQSRRPIGFPTTQDETEEKE